MFFPPFSSNFILVRWVMKGLLLNFCQVLYDFFPIFSTLCHATVGPFYFPRKSIVGKKNFQADRVTRLRYVILNSKKMSKRLKILLIK